MARQRILTAWGAQARGARRAPALHMRATARYSHAQPGVPTNHHLATYAAPLPLAFMPHSTWSLLPAAYLPRARGAAGTPALKNSIRKQHHGNARVTRFLHRALRVFVALSRTTGKEEERARLMAGRALW